MEFEAVIKEVEAMMMPELQQRSDALRSDHRFSDIRLGAIRHHDALHTIGLSCHPIASSSPFDRCSISVNIMANSSLLIRGFVTWSQPYHLEPIKTSSGAVSGYRKLSGYTIREGMTRPFKFRPGETVEDFVLLLSALYRAFDRGARRGHPPGTIRKLWNRLVLSDR
jgi:hypothetical protein